MADPSSITLTPRGEGELQKLQDDEPLPITPLEEAVPAAEEEPSAEASAPSGTEEEASEEAIIEALRGLRDENPGLVKKLLEEAGLTAPAAPDEQVVIRELELNKRERGQSLKEARTLYQSWSPQNVAHEALQAFGDLQKQLYEASAKALEEGDSSKLMTLDPQSAAAYVEDRVEKAQAAASYYATVQIGDILMDALQADPAHRHLSQAQRAQLDEASKKPTSAEQLAATVQVYLEAARQSVAEGVKKQATEQAGVLEKAQRLASVLPKGRKQATAAPTVRLDAGSIEALPDDEFDKLIAKDGALAQAMRERLRS